MQNFNLKLKMLRMNNKIDEKGFTILEVFIALFVSSMIIFIMVGLYSLSAGKTTYIAKDSNILRFESNISDWIEKDFRKNRIQDIIVDSVNNDVLTFDLGNNESIVYEDRKNGFYRVEKLKTGDKSLLLTEEDILEMKLSDNKKVLTLRYGSVEFDKTITILMNK